jgi:hypothetical protein
MSSNGAKRFIKIFPLLLLLLILVDCGGSGGGSGSAGGEGTTSPYTGLTSQAKIDETNAQQLASEVYGGGGSFGSDLSMMSSISVKSQNYLSPLIDISQTIRQTFKGFTITPDEGDIEERSSTIIPNQPEIIPGKTGTLTRTININETTYEVTGSLVFDNYNPGAATTFTGQITFSGQYVKNTGKLLLNCTFKDYGETSDLFSITLIGTATVQITDTELSMDLNTYVKDGNSGKVYWFKDTSLEITESSGSIGYNVDIKGHYYNPDYGYVDFETLEPFAYSSTADENPSLGTLELTGLAGSKADFIVVDSTSGYRIEVDNNGDGNMEWNSDIIPW